MTPSLIWTVQLVANNEPPVQEEPPEAQFRNWAPLAGSGAALNVTVLLGVIRAQQVRCSLGELALHVNPLASAVTVAGAPNMLTATFATSAVTDRV